ncbi:MAG: hypothetical protein ACT4O5_12125 [Gammaproteobacteria bacterium]
MMIDRIAEGQTEADRLKNILTTGAAVANSAASVPAAAPAGGVGAAAGGWDTAVNRDAAITTINGLRTLASELQTQLNALLAELRNRKIIA